MRVWSVVRTPQQIRDGMDADDGRGEGGFDNPGLDADQPGLVAYWKFDEGAWASFILPPRMNGIQ